MPLTSLTKSDTIILSIAVLALIGTLLWIRLQPPLLPSSPQEAEAQFVRSSGRIDIGTVLYHQDQKVAGTVKEVANNHSFPDGTYRKAVKIMFLDGTEQWVPRDAVKTLYLVKQ